MMSIVSRPDSVVLLGGFGKLCFPCVMFAIALLTAHNLFGQSLDSIQGKWKVVLLTYGGDTFHFHPDGAECTISGHEFVTTMLREGEWHTLDHYHIDVEKGSPARIDLIPRRFPPKPDRPMSEAEKKYGRPGFPGIFQLKDGFLEIYFPMISKDDRPKTIPRDGAGGHVYYRMKRLASVDKPGKKGEKKGKTTSASSPPRDVSKGDATLSGGSPTISEANSKKKRIDELVHSITEKEMTIKSLKAELQRLKIENKRLMNELTKARREREKEKVTATKSRDIKKEKVTATKSRDIR